MALSPEEYDLYLNQQVAAMDCAPEEAPVRDSLGKSRVQLMQPRLPVGISHAALPLLLDFATNGCPVDCGPDWSKQRILLTMKRGAHKSTYDNKALVQLRAETKDKVAQGYARVVRWGI